MRCKSDSDSDLNPDTFLGSRNNVILMYIEFGMAQKYVDDLSRNVKRGLRTKVEKGWVCFPIFPDLDKTRATKAPVEVRAQRTLPLPLDTILNGSIIPTSSLVPRLVLAFLRHHSSYHLERFDR
jgi:hypothetical protein